MADKFLVILLVIIFIFIIFFYIFTKYYVQSRERKNKGKNKDILKKYTQRNKKIISQKHRFFVDDDINNVLHGKIFQSITIDEIINEQFLWRENNQDFYFDYGQNMYQLIKYLKANKIMYPKHIGQRKLLFSEIQFLNEVHMRINEDKYRDLLVLYIGSAHGIHLQFLMHLYPNVKWILVDPSNYVLIFDDVSNSDKCKYYDFKIGKWIETKGIKETVAFSENKINKIHENDPKWISYDQRRVNYHYFPRFDDLKEYIDDGNFNNDKQVYIINDFMEFQYIETIKKLISSIRNRNTNLLFISDIRAGKDMKQTMLDQNSQQIWMIQLESDFGFNKFKSMYYYDNDNTARNNMIQDVRQDFVDKLEKNGIKYKNVSHQSNQISQHLAHIQCDFYTQIWAPALSSEMRQFYVKKDHKGVINIDFLDIQKFELYNQLIMTKKRIQIMKNDHQGTEWQEIVKKIIQDNQFYDQVISTYDYHIQMKILKDYCDIFQKDIMQIFKEDAKCHRTSYFLEQFNIDRQGNFNHYIDDLFSKRNMIE